MVRVYFHSIERTAKSNRSSSVSDSVETFVLASILLCLKCHRLRKHVQLDSFITYLRKHVQVAAVAPLPSYPIMDVYKPTSSHTWQTDNFGRRAE